jgi:hypothetical protein
MFCQFIDLMAIHLENYSFMDVTECLYSRIGNSIDGAAFFLGLCVETYMPNIANSNFKAVRQSTEKFLPLLTLPNIG